MPSLLSYPGVYIQEIPSGVRTITGVATSITAFIGRTVLGPVNQPVTLNSYGDFERQFGGLDVGYPLSYAVRDFFVNGGATALIVRLYKNPDGVADADAAASIKVDDLALVASSQGTWGKDLRVSLDVNVPAEVRTGLGLAADAALFNMTVALGNTTERFLNVTVTDNARRVDRVLADGSNLIRWKGAWPATPAMGEVKAATAALKAWNDAKSANPPDQPTIDAKAKAYQAAAALLADPVTQAQAKLAADLAVNPQVPADITADQKAISDALAAIKAADSATIDQAAFLGSQDNKTGLYALAKADLFNLLCIPPDTRGGDVPAPVYQTAMAYCATRRAMLIVDSPSTWSTNKNTAAATARDHLSDLGLSGDAARNAALYFPRLLEADPLRQGQIDTFVPCGAIAGVMARIDSARGVWKAPAGLEAAVNGIQGFNVTLNDAENGMLNPLGINCFRAFPINGRVVWGARTVRGADQLADEYKYIPVRRTALYIEESLFRGTQWVVFEPNDEPLWAQIRLNVGAFMQGLFRQGAFQGQTPRDAYFVKCDKETTTQNDINSGIVNIVVGFAPLKPAEFVVIQLQQIAGQIQT